MATSLINTECKRYGCIKNLLACYANCRYSTRCEDLRNEIIEKTDQAASDINNYLASRGAAPISIQVLKRGLKFAEAPNVPAASNIAHLEPTSPRVKKRPRPKRINKGFSTDINRKPQRSELTASVTTKIKQAQPRRRNGKARAGAAVMSRKSNRQETGSTAKIETRETNATAPSVIAQQKSASGKKSATRKKARRTSASSNGHSRKLYIIVEGKTAVIVDERGLMSHLLGGGSAEARYFEAKEVEARVQIVAKG
jgi:hypothetical protein